MYNVVQRRSAAVAALVSGCAALVSSLQLHMVHCQVNNLRVIKYTVNYIVMKGYFQCTELEYQPNPKYILMINERCQRAKADRF